MKTRTVIWTSMLAVLAAPAFGAFDTNGWTWQRPVSTSATQADYVRLPLPLEVIDESQASLSDLRIVDKAGNLVPFVTHRTEGQQAVRLTWREVGLLNPVFQPEQYSRVTVDFGEPTRKNRVKVDTSEQNFRRRVLIEGSPDGAAWDIVLENGWLFDVPLPDKVYRIDELSFPLNDFRYLRLTVYNMPDDPRRIDIRSVRSAFAEEPPPAKLIPVEPKSRQSGFDEKKKESIYTLDLGFKNVPVAEFAVVADTDFYYRAYELSGRNAEKAQTRRKGESGWEVEEREAPWEPISSGVLFRIQQENKISESNALTGLDAPYRYLRLRVFEQDNPPLLIQRVDVKRRELSLVFQARPAETYALIGGNAEAVPPSFDLPYALAGLGDRQLATAEVGAPQPLVPTPKTLAWNERYAVLLWVALVLAVVAAAALIVRNLGALKETGSKQSS